MPEPVRLLIWDLDDTFWRGTLTEGGIEFQRAHKNIVIQLAKRGIVSSICSKNDFDDVKAILVKNGVWDYFVLPNISWGPKGPRIQSLIETVGLRPPTVMVLDDNPMNLEEVRHFVPDIQTASVDFVPELLKNPLFRGKDDRSLIRLKQYKALEQRKIDERSAGADVVQFLRDSDIRVRLEFDIKGNLDRSIELINRTNQLNFTKKRLSEDPKKARTELLDALSSYAVQAALVEVNDRYGKHGYCGFYMNQSENRDLEHFCFSCRILGLGVERWLYQKLGRPQLTIKGEVIADVFDPAPVDWITQAFDREGANGEPVPQLDKLKITARGSCDLGAIIHYFTATTDDVVGEHHIFRDGGTFRIDHSIFLRHAVEGLSVRALETAKRLRYLETDFQTRLFHRDSTEHVVLLSFSSDFAEALYRHRETGLIVPCPLAFSEHSTSSDLRAVPDHEMPPGPEWRYGLMGVLREEFEFIGLIQEQQFKSNVRLALSHLPRSSRIFFLSLLGSDERGRPIPRMIEMNKWLVGLAKDFHNVEIINPADKITVETEIEDLLHFDRAVYFRLYEDLRARICQGERALSRAARRVMRSRGAGEQAQV
jgi:FkbH-like protein